jgi:hypothetical protein
MSTTSSRFIFHSFHGRAAEIWSGSFAVSWGKETAKMIQSKQFHRLTDIKNRNVCLWVFFLLFLIAITSLRLLIKLSIKYINEYVPYYYLLRKHGCGIYFFKLFCP